MARLRKFLVGRQGESSEATEELAALFTPYLTSVLLPSLTEKPSLRNSRELLTLASTLDALISGDLEAVGDFLVTRFQAVETATQDGNWALAKHLELIGDSKVSSVTPGLREEAIKQEAKETRLRRLEHNE